MTYYAALDVGVRSLALSETIPNHRFLAREVSRCVDEGLDEAANVCCATHRARPKVRLSSPIRPMLVPVCTTRKADHVEKRDPRQLRGRTPL